MKRSSYNEEYERNVSDVFNFFHMQDDYSIIGLLEEEIFCRLGTVF